MKYRKIIFFLVCLLFYIGILRIPTVQHYYTTGLVSLLTITTEFKEVGNIVFRYDKNYQHIVDEIEKEVKNINELGNSWFNGETNSSLTVYLPKSFIASVILKGSNAIFIPKSNIAVLDGRLSEDSLIHALTHEYAHFHMMNKIEDIELSISDVPEWFHEGVAEAFAHRFAPLPFVEAINWWHLIPFSEMKFRGGGSGEVISEWYVMAHFTVEKLLKDHGDHVINSLIELTKETSDFTVSFNSLTGQQLEDYHEWLVVDHQFFEEKVEALYVEEDFEKLKEILLQYDYENGPYYFWANRVYSLLENIYVREEQWAKAIDMVVKRSYYIQDPAFWRDASEYALNLDDAETALYFAQKAADNAGEYSEDYFNDWLNIVRKQTETVN
jgi:hypothetical protein